MSNDSKFLNIQLDVCQDTKPEEKPIDRVCPTCIPEDSYIPPNWWEQRVPWLNRKTCEYSVTVFINQDGEHYQLSDLREIFHSSDNNEITISESGIPEPRPTSGAAQAESLVPKENKELFDRIKRSFVKPGIRQMLRYYNKLESDDLICAKQDCSIFTTAEAATYIRQRVHYAQTHSDTSFIEFLSKDEEGRTGLPIIDNYDALELFATATEYYFFGTANNVMAVLVTLPAHIFDQVPEQPAISSVSVDIESIRFKANEFELFIERMESTFALFSKYQSYFNHTENGKLFHTAAIREETIEEQEDNMAIEGNVGIEGFSSINEENGILEINEPTPFYCEFLKGSFERFKDELNAFIESKGYNTYNPWTGIVSWQGKDTAVEIELIFDKSNPERPYQLADTMIIRTPGCKDIELTLPPDPKSEAGFSDNIRYMAKYNQTLMTYIANYEEIKVALDANTSPPWIDFLIQYTFPPLDVSYGTSLSSQNTAVGCLLDVFTGLDDFVLNEVMGFYEAFTYQWNKNNCRLLTKTDDKKPEIPSKAVKKMKDEKKDEKIKDESPFQPFFKKKFTGNNWDDFLLVINPCNWKAHTMKAVKCLMSGMTFEEGFTATMRGLLQDVGSEVLEIVIMALPADKQQEIKDKISSQFKDLPFPWEEGYDPGNVESAYDRAALETVMNPDLTASSFEAVDKELKKAQAEKTTLESLLKDRTKSYSKFLEEYNKKEQDLQSKKQTAQNIKISTNLELNNAKDMTEKLKKLENEAYRVYQDAKALSLQAGAVGALALSQLDELLKSLNDSTLAHKDAEMEQSKKQLEEDAAIQKYAAAEAELATHKITFKSEESFNESLDNQLDNLNDKIKELSKRFNELQKEQSKIDKDKETKNYIGFADKTPEEQEEIVKKAKERIRYTSIRQGDKIKQGTYGRAVSNVQKELHDAYVEAILESADIRELSKAVQSIPGSKIFGEIFASLDCPGQNFFSPPIDEFLGTFTLDICGKGKTRPFSIPELRDLGSGWSYWSAFTEALEYTFQQAFSRILAAMMAKVMGIVDSAICTGFAALGAGVDIAAQAAYNDGKYSPSIDDIFDDIICANFSEEEKTKKLEELFAFSNATGTSGKTRQILEDMSYLGSADEYFNAMVGNGSAEFLTNVSTTISILHPETAASLGNPDGLSKFLQICSNFMTDEQRENAQNLLQEDAPFFPLDPSICLTNDEAQQYYENLKDVYAKQIGEPDIAEEFVEGLRSQRRSDLTTVAQIIATGPEGALQKEIDDLLAPPDPDCEFDKSILKDTPEIKDKKAKIITGQFASLQKAFLDDTIDQNPFEFTDTVGALLLITADVVGYNYAFHVQLRNNWFFRFLAFCGFFDSSAPFPETVGIQMRNEILGNQKSYSTDSQFKLSYNNNLNDEDAYETEIKFTETYPIVPVLIGSSNSNTHNSNFDYKYEMFKMDNIISKTTNKPKEFFVVENHLTPQETEYVKRFEPTNAELSYATEDGRIFNSYRNQVFKNFIKERLKDVGNLQIDNEKSFVMMKNINESLVYDLRNKLLSDENGETSVGFLHGGTNQDFTVDDFTYVDPTPGATSYSYDEEDNILGRSLTNNPRVKFLDPVRHGGSFELPNIYIEPEPGPGWVDFCRLIVPGFNGCPDQASNFLELEQLEKKIGEIGQQITPDERLTESPECVTEVPFEKIASPASLAALEGSVRATIRVYLAHFLINSYSIHGNLALNFNNYDELIYEYIATKIAKRTPEQFSWFAITYEGYTYWLLFLEQCAQAFNRMVKNGDFEPTEEESRALEIINDAQIKYEKPLKKDAWSFVGPLGINGNQNFEKDFRILMRNEPKTISEFLALAEELYGETYSYPIVGQYLISANVKKWYNTFEYTDIPGEDEVKRPTSQIIHRTYSFWYATQNMISFAAKIATIALHEDTCKIFLKRLIKQEFDFYSEKFASQLKPRPYVYDINKFFIGGSNITYGDQIRAGVYDVEVPIGQASGLPQTEQLSTQYYGTVNHCITSDGIHPLKQANISEEEILQIQNSGGFYLEKYLKITPKGAPLTRLEEDFSIDGRSDPLQQRSDKFLTKEQLSKPNDLPSGVQNIKEFVEFLNTQEIDENVNISDWFGNAEVSPTARGYVGSTGITFGVRLCYIPSQDVQLIINEYDTEKGEDPVSEQERIYVSDPDFNNSIPLASYEKDILDKKLFEFKDANDDFDQEIKCYIDGLVETEEFNLLFNKIFNIKKVGSSLAVYSDLNFVSSIGLGPNERRDAELGGINIFNLGADPELAPSIEDRSDFFNDCRAVCRRIFVANYKRNDFTPANEEEGLSDLELLTQKLLEKSYRALQIDNFGDIPWQTRQRILNLSRPRDAEQCGNQFSALQDTVNPASSSDSNSSSPLGGGQVTEPEQPPETPDTPQDESPGGQGDSGFSGGY